MSVYLPSLTGGGSQINALRLAGWFAADGYQVDIVVHDRGGHLSDRVPAGIRVVELSRASEPWTRLHMLYAARNSPRLFCASIFRSRKQLDRLLYLPALTRYLRRRRPAIVFSNLWQMGINLVLARAAACPRMPVVCIFRSAFFMECTQAMANAKRPRKWRLFLDYCRQVYSQADQLVTVSEGVAADLRDRVGVPGDRIRVIYNPSASPEILTQAAEPAAHPWFDGAAEAPVILAVGRLSAEKRFDQLIDAFAIVAAEHTTARLMIIGDGDLRDALTSQVEALGLTDRVALPGWYDNPYAYMRRCAVFVLCSRSEGLSTVLIEAMYCGAPVVSNDCPHGPREILEDGRYGRLVPLDDVRELASAISETLIAPPARDRLVTRARWFSPERSAAAYRDVLNRLIG